MLGHHEDIIISISDTYPSELVSWFWLHDDEPGRSDIFHILHIDPFDDGFLGDEGEMFPLDSSEIEDGGDLFFFLEREEIDDRLTLGSALCLRYLVGWEWKYSTRIGEEEEIAMIAGREDDLYFVFVFDRDIDPLPSTTLCAESGWFDAFDVRILGEGDDDFFIGDSIFWIPFSDRSDIDLGSTRIPVLVLDFSEFISHNGVHPLWTSEDILEISDEEELLGEFVLDLFAFETGETLELHLEDGLWLLVRESELGHEIIMRFFFTPRFFDRLDHRIDIVEGDFETFEDVGASLSDHELVASSAFDNFTAVDDEFFEHLEEIE
ncbi:MAG: hypothetical protein ACD_78C00408G0002 [uncultured bacterium (gcode 4)]|uniref:Uncharacterized protein n=1 Tax=uncultured bacterium (gcode 4) TaxID=1234023 RepID=K1YAK1_9BACT|nr:MAG: hypothetical protein ACD_78C00408G0002 [uncultured bacterium (gcode 4)]